MLKNTGGLASSCLYTETGQKQWISSGGTLTIDTLTGKTFTFTVHAASMALNPALGGNTATGSFTLDGTGTATLP